jgi:uncharacterized phage-associated protein
MFDVIEFNYKKATQLINYFISLYSEPVNKVKILKLAWLVDRYHIRRYGRPVLGDTYYAMKMGPVASLARDIIEIKDQYVPKDQQHYISLNIKKVGANKIESLRNPELSYFSKSDLEAMKKVFDEFGGVSWEGLSLLSHKYPEWKKHEKTLGSDFISSIQMNYLDFFENPRKEDLSDDFFDFPEEMIKASEELYRENYLDDKLWD